MHNAILCATQACYRFWIVPHFSQTYIDRPVSSNRAGANIHARIGDSNIRHITGHKNDHHHGCALCRSNSILSESNGSMGSSHMTVCEPGHLGYKEYTSELLPVLPSGLLSGTAVSSGRLSTGERLSESNDSANPTTQRRTRRRCHGRRDQTLHCSAHLMPSVLHHFVPSRPSSI